MPHQPLNTVMTPQNLPLIFGMTAPTPVPCSTGSSFVKLNVKSTTRKCDEKKTTKNDRAKSVGAVMPSFQRQVWSQHSYFNPNEGAVYKLYFFP